MAMLFKLGQVVMTAGVEALINDKQGELSHIDLSKILNRHQSGDDGDTCTEDKQANQFAIKQGDLRIMSVYKLTSVTLWIITEHNRSYTTILLPEEY